MAAVSHLFRSCLRCGTLPILEQPGKHHRFDWDQNIPSSLRASKTIFTYPNMKRTWRVQYLPGILTIGECILLRLYPVMLINHSTQQCLGLVFIVHSHMFRPRSVAIFMSYVTKYILLYYIDINVATLEYILSHST
jgi:hypothetical protein